MSTTRQKAAKKILARLLAGETCALVTDAGSPAISDPGEDLVRLCAEKRRDGLRDSGPCALVTALSISACRRAGSRSRGFCPSTKKAVRST